ncbi:hypothetical protein FQ087_06055 [Sporosarcina sp. ANT_H38]|uniref:hypothetical protein n=1 Tax=Sporosarcina sp. ANT_H38 TaxID=2597358 RepID=UPI0011F26CD7|nr:hypothetical protein [Sporosarcina sp. ANT_H38]KAA0965828.1 hypothetical protein FQ087_06055 [Sporosarcina sp. ANT_H38]
MDRLISLPLLLSIVAAIALPMAPSVESLSGNTASGPASPQIVIVKALYPLLPGVSSHDWTSIRPRFRLYLYLCYSH